MSRNKAKITKQSERKVSSTRLPKKVFLAALLCLIGMVGIFFLYLDWANERNENTLHAFKSTIRQYAFRRAPGDVWLANDTKNIPENIVKHYQNLLTESFRKYGSISPLAKRIAALRPLPIARLEGHNLFATHAFTTEGKALNEIIKIVLVPRDQKDVSNFVLQYSKEGQGVLIYCLDWPRNIFAAVMFHELGHGLRYAVDGAESSTAQAFSDLWIGEEIEMHELEGDILNKASRGSFYAFLDKLAESSEARSPKDFVLSLNIADLKKIETIVGCVACGPSIASVIVAEYVIAAAIRFINIKKLPSTEKVVFYRWYASLP